MRLQAGRPRPASLFIAAAFGAFTLASACWPGAGQTAQSPLAVSGPFADDALEGKWLGRGTHLSFARTAQGWVGTFGDFRLAYPPLSDIRFDARSGTLTFKVPSGPSALEKRFSLVMVRYQGSNGCAISGTVDYDYLEGRTLKTARAPYEAGATYLHARGGGDYKSKCFSMVIPGVTPGGQANPSAPGPMNPPPPPAPPPAADLPHPFVGQWTLHSGGGVGDPDERKAHYVGTISFEERGGSYTLGGSGGPLVDVVITGSKLSFKRRLPGFDQHYEGTITGPGHIEGSFDHQGKKFRWWATR